MGSQQLLLLIVGTLVVGLMIAVAITLFVDNAVSSNRDAVSNQLAALASRAQVYKMKPHCLGGGGGSFHGFTLPVSSNSIYATFSVLVATNSAVTIEGIGNEIGFDQATKVKVTVTVASDTISVAEVN
jgi:hypothetical protein